MILSKKNIVGPLALLILLLTFFYSYASRSLFDSDFWWHISTGRHILQHNTIPDTDPFSFTSALEENKNLYPLREKFILKQYWLAQIIFYRIYNYAGAAGIIVLRALLLTLTIVFVLWRLQRWRVSLPITFVSIFVLYIVLLRSTGERPVLFTILFTAVIFFILEDFKEKRDRRIFLLLPVMLFWANLHGGFILGMVMIIVYMLGEGLKIVLKRTLFSKKEMIFFYAATASALGLSFINPTGWDAFLIAFSDKYIPFTTGIQEYNSPYLNYVNKLYPADYYYAALVVLFPLLLLLRRRRFNLTHVILLSGLFFMSLSASRFISYFAIIASMVLGKEADALLKGLFNSKISGVKNALLSTVFAFICLLSAVFFAVGIFRFELMTFKVAKGYSVPERAVDFLKENKLEGNIFNDHAYGGYLTWRLYPQQTFIDTRSLNYTVMTEYSWILNASTSRTGKELAPGKIPLWKRLLEHYNIDIIFLSILDVYGQVPNLLFKLAEDDAWAPVYCDKRTVIFIKNSEKNRGIIEKTKLSKDIIFNMTIINAAESAMVNTGNRLFLVSLGDTFYTMGRLNDALTAYKYAMYRLQDPRIQVLISKIEAEIRKKGEK